MSPETPSISTTSRKECTQIRLLTTSNQTPLLRPIRLLSLPSREPPARLKILDLGPCRATLASPRASSSNLGGESNNRLSSLAERPDLSDEAARTSETKEKHEGTNGIGGDDTASDVKPCNRCKKNGVECVCSFTCHPRSLLIVVSSSPSCLFHPTMASVSRLRALLISAFNTRGLPECRAGLIRGARGSQGPARQPIRSRPSESPGAAGTRFW